MRLALYRTEPGRFELNALCEGKGSITRNGDQFEFKGVDVSQRGLGCLIRGNVHQGDIIVLRFPKKEIQFNIQWIESHLGIDGIFRVGLTPTDRHLDILQFMLQLGYTENKTTGVKTAS
jgi:hypothetical protein